MLHLVGIKRKSLRDSDALMPPEHAEEVHALGARLRGARVLHLHSTSYGGGVAELLLSLVALEKDLGLEVEWRNLSGDPDFFGITKHMHNALQGRPYQLTREARSTASMAGDDPEGWEIYRTILDERHGDEDLSVFTNLVGVGSLEVNCFQRAASVAIQKSIREGFGLAVAEALWKGVPVVAGATGGIPLQMHDGLGGYLISTNEQCAERTLDLLRHRDEARQIAEAGQRRIRDRFLIPRLLRDELRLFAEIRG